MVGSIDVDSIGADAKLDRVLEGAVVVSARRCLEVVGATGWGGASPGVRVRTKIRVCRRRGGIVAAQEGHAGGAHYGQRERRHDRLVGRASAKKKRMQRGKNRGKVTGISDLRAVGVVGMPSTWMAALLVSDT